MCLQGDITAGQGGETSVLGKRNRQPWSNDLIARFDEAIKIHGGVSPSAVWKVWSGE